MTRSKLDWYKRNPSKFIGGTVGMTFELKGAYSILLDLIYDGGGSCPDDPRWIANLLGVEMTVRRWNQIRAKLIEVGKLVPAEGRLFNPAATRIIARDREPENGPKTGPRPAGEPFYNQDKSDFIDPKKPPVNRTGLFEANDLTPTTPPQTPILPARARENQSQSQNDKTSSTETVGLVEQVAQALNQKRGKYWATDAARMLDEGIAPADLLEAARAHRGGEIKSLNALRGLARHKAAERIAQGAGDGDTLTPAGPIVVTDQDWDTALARLLRSGIWNHERLGPSPFDASTQCPTDKVEGFFLAWVKQGAHPLREIDASSNIVDYPAEYPSLEARKVWSPAR